MTAIISATRSALAIPALLARIYVAYVCMSLGPSPKIRRWGMVTWWRLAHPSYLVR